MGPILGRPSLAEQRTAEILNAFERCVARFGIEGSSLEKIAEEAGMKRSILRHYIGNRHELVEALADRVIGVYEADFESHLSDHSELPPVEQLMSYLFPPSAISTADSLMVVESLIAASATSIEIRIKMRRHVEYLIERSSQLIRQNYPHSPKHKCWAVAYGVVSICFNHESLTPLQPPPKYRRAAQSSARALIDTLAT